MGRYDEAATWFARRADLKRDAYQSWLADAQGRQMAIAADGEAKMEAMFQRARAGEAKETDPAKRATWHAIVMGTPNTRHALREAVVSAIEIRSRDNGDYATLLKYCQEEVRIRRSELADLKALGADQPAIEKKEAEIATSSERVAGAQVDLALYADAEKTYREALAIRRALPADLPDRDLYSTSSDLGGLYEKQGDFARARDAYTQSLAEWEAAAPARRARIDGLSSDEAKALQGATDTLGHTLLLNNLGYVFSNLGDYRKALDRYQAALDVVETLPAAGETGYFRASMRSSVLNNLAALHGDSGNLDRALDEMRQVIALKREIGDDEGAAISLQNAGGLYADKGDTESARRFIAQSRRIFIAAQALREVVAATLSLAALASDAGDLAAAEADGQEALALARKTGDVGWIGAGARALAAIRLKQHRPDDAERLLQEAEDSDRRVGAPLDAAYTDQLEGRLLVARGRSADAVEKYRAAIGLIEAVHATAGGEGFGELRNHYRPYEEIVELLVKLGRLDEAFDYLSRARSKRMNDSLRLSSVRSTDKRLQSLLDRAAALQGRLRSAQSDLAAEQAKPTADRDTAKIGNLKLVAARTQTEFFQVSEAIKAANPNYESILTVKPRELKAAQRSLPAGLLLVEYAPIGDQLYIFTVTRDTLRIYTPPARPDDLWARVRAFRAQIVDPHGRAGQSFAAASPRPDAAAVRAVPEPLSAPGSTEGGPSAAGPSSGAGLRGTLTALYDMLLAPIEPELRAADTVAFIPTQLLYYLPIHALAHVEGDSLRFFIEEKPVVYLSSADVLSIVRPRDPAALGAGLAAFGDPAGIEPPLPHTLDEVNAIARVYPDAVVLTGARATKAEALAPAIETRRILHFATHGFLDAGDPTHSFIALAKGGTPEAGELTVGEVMGLDLNRVDLVTLSACQTALGERNPGIEVSDMAAAFATAGASSVIASLWSVSDESTNVLMAAFYRGLAGGKSKATALQAAEIELLRDPRYADPFYWAPFVLMGDWR